MDTTVYAAATMEWIKTSFTKWDGRDELSVIFRISFNTRSLNGSEDAGVLDADATTVPSAACWDQSVPLVSEWSKGNTVSFGLRDMIRRFRDCLGR